MFLYENVKTKARTTFSKFDLGLIDNSEIDKKLHTENKKIYKYIVYDRVKEKEKEYDDLHRVAKDIKCHICSATRAIRERKWLFNRYFIERIDIWKN